MGSIYYFEDTSMYDDESANREIERLKNTIDVLEIIIDKLLGVKDAN